VRGVIRNVNVGIIQEMHPGRSREEAHALIDEIEQTLDTRHGISPEDLVSLPDTKFFRKRGPEEFIFGPYDVRGQLLTEYGRPLSPDGYLRPLSTAHPASSWSREYNKYVEQMRSTTPPGRGLSPGQRAKAPAPLLHTFCSLLCPLCPLSPFPALSLSPVSFPVPVPCLFYLALHSCYFQAFAFRDMSIQPSPSLSKHWSNSCGVGLARAKSRSPRGHGNEAIVRLIGSTIFTAFTPASFPVDAANALVRSRCLSEA
jgi:hypothetical protein